MKDFFTLLLLWIFDRKAAKESFARISEEGRKAKEEKRKGT